MTLCHLRYLLHWLRRICKIMKKFCKSKTSKREESDLEKIVFIDVRGEPSERLPARAAQPDQQRVRARLRQHAANARHVLDREPGQILMYKHLAFEAMQLSATIQRSEALASNGNFQLDSSNS